MVSRTAVPVSYVVLGLNIAQDLGVEISALLKDAGMSSSELERPDARVSLLQCLRLISRVIRQTSDHACLGYEFGLRSNLAAHGNVGFGLMSHATVGEALAFGLKYGRLRNPILKLELSVEQDEAIIEVRPGLPLGPLRQKAVDAVLISLVRIGRQLSGSFKPELTLHFKCAEPAHYSRYRHRLPPTFFKASANQLRFPAEYLSRPLHTRDSTSARMMAKQCARDLILIDDGADLDERVRVILQNAEGQYPNLDAVASQLHMSGRSLKRKLKHRGLCFLDLMEEARKRDSLALLGDESLTISAVAQRVGYSDPASFTRAFRKWTGRTPSDWRSAPS